MSPQMEELTKWILRARFRMDVNRSSRYRDSVKPFLTNIQRCTRENKLNRENKLKEDAVLSNFELSHPFQKEIRSPNLADVLHWLIRWNVFACRENNQEIRDIVWNLNEDIHVVKREMVQRFVQNYCLESYLQEMTRFCDLLLVGTLKTLSNVHSQNFQLSRRKWVDERVTSLENRAGFKRTTSWVKNTHNMDYKPPLEV